MGKALSLLFWSSLLAAIWMLAGHAWAGSLLGMLVAAFFVWCIVAVLSIGGRGRKADALSLALMVSATFKGAAMWGALLQFFWYLAVMTGAAIAVLILPAWWWAVMVAVFLGACVAGVLSGLGRSP